MPAPLVIGWQETVDFLDWDIERVRVKIDTGARTSALDARTCKLLETPDGVVAELGLALQRRRPERVTIIRAPVLGMVLVKNTSGAWEERPLVETRIRLGPIVKVIRLTVASRARMRFRVILGRKALEGDFVVDVARKYLLKKNFHV